MNYDKIPTRTVPEVTNYNSDGTVSMGKEWTWWDTPSKFVEAYRKELSESENLNVKRFELIKELFEYDNPNDTTFFNFSLDGVKDQDLEETVDKIINVTYAQTRGRFGMLATHINTAYKSLRDQ